MKQDILHSGRMTPRHRGILESDAPTKKAPEPKFAGLSRVGNYMPGLGES